MVQVSSPEQVVDDRTKAILSSPLAADQESLATHLATETNLSVKAALEIMAISARNIRPAVDPQGNRVFRR
ncbi:hypothetical protein N2603_23355 [Bradyrhizobium huanghuaihaiense]|uniref:hypothetical protein n=1 Tax=Bradyrhizobium huanghuaihaiense TaxID=990078 RepID=UPI0021A9BE2F|nr:hypothetical protein [Bradyrhizobium sp. CB3035]UWU73044.1 hypothetical protein N2603_23355 [Bradyrhizobium sp. CB3035]